MIRPTSGNPGRCPPEHGEYGEVPSGRRAGCVCPKIHSGTWIGTGPPVPSLRATAGLVVGPAGGDVQQALRWCAGHQLWVAASPAYCKGPLSTHQI